MRLGIIGLPQSGKTTIFNALTRGDTPTSVSGGRIEIHTAVVDVPDPRIDQLTELFRPAKTTYAKVTYADIAGLGNGGEKAESAIFKNGLSGQLLNQLRQMDGFVHVIRVFESPSVPHPYGSQNPERDIASMDAELLLNDLITVERKLERLAEEKKKSAGSEKAQIENEIGLFKRFQQALTDDVPLRDIPIEPEEEKWISGFGLLTLKPVLLILNRGDGQDAPQIDYPHQKSMLLSLQGRLEMELAQFTPEEAEIFMHEFGIKELGLQRVIRESDKLLGLQSFFTVGEDEVRAWTIRRGANAYDAAGVIHSDLKKGFIRAEVVEFDTLISLGGLSEARSKGRLRLEGKDYLVNDGEIMHVRFNL